MSQKTAGRGRHSGRLRRRTHPARARADRINETAGRRVRLFRRAAGLTQSQLGECVGVSFQQIQKYENGVTGIKLGSAVLMAEALGVGLHDLVDDDATANDASKTNGTALLEDLGRLSAGQRRTVEELIRLLRTVAE